MAPLPSSTWLEPNSQSPAQSYPPHHHFTQGATCQPLEASSPYQNYQQQPNYSPRAPVAPTSTMQQYIQSPPSLVFDSSPDQQQFSDTEGFELDHDILNNLNYLDQFNFADYTDFDLVPQTEDYYIESSFPTPAGFFPPLDTNTPPESMAPSGQQPQKLFHCQFEGCTKSFARQCELTRHEHKHTRPFRCPHCGRAFAEKRRCVQHIQSVHDLATEKDKTKCHMCFYAHVRPDAVKRHMRLKHGVGAKYETSPSTNSEGQISDKEMGRGKSGRGRPEKK